MHEYETTMEIRVRIEYTTDKYLRQGDDAGFGSDPFVDDVSYEILDDLDKMVKEDAIEHFEGVEGGQCE